MDWKRLICCPLEKLLSSVLIMWLLLILGLRGLGSSDISSEFTYWYLSLLGKLNLWPMLNLALSEVS